MPTFVTSQGQKQDTTYFIDGVGVDAESDLVKQRQSRAHRRRPDRHAFIVEVPSSVFFATRSMPQTNTRYSVVIGETFWRLAAYIDSVPTRAEERLAAKPPHVLLCGIHGCGKSYLSAAAAALLGLRPHSPRPLRSDYRTVYIGDCRRWLESDDPLAYFRMELLAGIREEAEGQDGGAGGGEGEGPETQDHHSPAHLGCLACVEPFSHVEQARRFMDRCYAWMREKCPETLLVFFIDQAEELAGHPNSIPYKIVAHLLEARHPLLVFAVTHPHQKGFPFREACGLTLNMPCRVSASEFAKHAEVHGCLEDRTVFSDVGVWKDVRLWSGCVPGEVSSLLKQPGPSLVRRLSGYRKQVDARVAAAMGAFANVKRMQQRVLLTVLFAIISRTPLDMYEEVNMENILGLGPEINNLLLIDCLQSFDHSDEGILTLRKVPAAISMAVHVALCSTRTLLAISPSTPEMFEGFVRARLESPLLCLEAKRRLARFYAYTKLLWGGRPEWRVEAVTEMGERVVVKFKRPRIVVFAGQTPAVHCFVPSGPDVEHHGTPLAGSAGDFDSVVFIPGRTGYWFYDFFVFVPTERRLFAVSTSTIVGGWLKELQTRVGPMQLQQQREDGMLTPMILLEMWREVLTKAGYPKIVAKCCMMHCCGLAFVCGIAPPDTAHPADPADPTDASLAEQLEEAVRLSERRRK